MLMTYNTKLTLLELAQKNPSTRHPVLFYSYVLKTVSVNSFDPFGILYLDYYSKKAPKIKFICRRQGTPLRLHTDRPNPPHHRPVLMGWPVFVFSIFPNAFHNPV